MGWIWPNVCRKRSSREALCIPHPHLTTVLCHGQLVLSTVAHLHASRHKHGIYEACCESMLPACLPRWSGVETKGQAYWLCRDGGQLIHRKDIRKNCSRFCWVDLSKSEVTNKVLPALSPLPFQCPQCTCNSIRLQCKT